jgi:hypothetical protein
MRRYLKLFEGEKMILWLDDIRDPKDPLIIREYMQDKQLDKLIKQGYLVKWVKIGEEALPYIKNNQVQHISFDHDLGFLIDSGNVLAKQIEEMAHDKTIEPFTWDVHSDNPSGKRNIIATMQSADRYWGVE